MLYLVFCEQNVKVGYTKDEKTFKTRIKAYQTTNPLIKFIDTTDGTQYDEKQIHSYFFDKSSCFVKVENTEWYHCEDTNMLNVLKEKKFSYISSCVKKQLPTIETNKGDNITMDFSNFSAANARKISNDNSLYEQKKRKIVEKINIAASKGKTNVSVYFSSSHLPVVDWLYQKGFSVAMDLEGRYSYYDNNKYSGNFYILW